jgi:hypothetical protein
MDDPDLQRRLRLLEHVLDGEGMLRRLEEAVSGGGRRRVKIVVEARIREEDGGYDESRVELVCMLLIFNAMQICARIFYMGRPRDLWATFGVRD